MNGRAPRAPIARGTGAALLAAFALLALESLALRWWLPDAAGAATPARRSLVLLGASALFRFAFFRLEGSALLAVYLAWTRGAFASDAAAPAFRLRPACVHAAVVAALALATPAWLASGISSPPLLAVGAVAWHAAVAVAVGSAIASFATGAALRGWWRTNRRRAALAGVLALALSFLAGLLERRYVSDLWPISRVATSRLVAALLSVSHPGARVFVPGAGAQLQDPLIDAGPVQAHIGVACSGASAIGYALIVLAVTVLGAWPRMGLGRLLIAAVGTWLGIELLNALRMWLIVVVAGAFDYDFAIGPFHDWVGLLLFGAWLIAVAAGLPRWVGRPVIGTERAADD